MERRGARNIAAPGPYKSCRDGRPKKSGGQIQTSDDELTLYPWRKKVKTLPKSFKNPIVNIIRVGHVPKLASARERIREDLGINRKPPTAYQDENARSELEKLVKDTDLYDKAMWNESDE